MSNWEKEMDKNKQAQAFFQDYAAGRVAEHIQLGAALLQAKLDFSVQSLGRVDQLLTQIRQRVRPARKAFLNEQRNRHFMQALGFYLGEYLARASGLPLHWLDDGEAASVAADYSALSGPDVGGLIGNVGDTYITPLPVIAGVLFGGSDGQSCADFIQRFLTGLNARRQQDKNAQFSEYLKTFEQTGTLPGGLAFAEALHLINLDYSLSSLQRLDDLLGRLVDQLRPDRDAFIQHQNNINFLLLLTYYVGSTIARVDGHSLEWLNRDELKAQFSDAPEGFELNVTCLIDRRLYFPLGMLSRRLFRLGDAPSCYDYAYKIIMETPGTYFPIRCPASPAMQADARWLAAVRLAGFAAAFGASMVRDGAPLGLLVLEPNKGQGGNFIQLISDSFDESVSRGYDRLNRNPEQLPYQLMIGDGTAYLPTGKTQALSIDLRCYGATLGPGLEGLQRIELAVPFRPADGEGGFAVYTPRLIMANEPSDLRPELVAAFYAGVYQYRHDQFLWDACLDESR